MLFLIAAMAKNRVIGKDGKMPWHIPKELEIFKSVTMNHPIIMGRKTHESIGRILPNRTNIIVTRNKDYKTFRGVIVCNDLQEAISIGKTYATEVFVIGGEDIYKQALPSADNIYLSIIEKEYAGDAFFPEFEEDFSVFASEYYDDFTFHKYKRK